MKNKVSFFTFLAIDALLLAICIWEIPTVRLHFVQMSFLSPGGIVASQETHLILVAVSIMLIGVIPVYVLVFFFVWKYKAGKPGSNYSPNLDSKVGAILIWLIPGSIIFVLSFINWNSTHALDPSQPIVSDKKPITIEVVALQWKFLFIYPEQNIATVNFIEFPEDTPLYFKLTADAPMSSFWIPQLGSQIYAMAGMETHLYLIANELGDFRGMDTEINGDGFSDMKFIARSSSQNDFNQWIASVKKLGNSLDLNAYNALSQPSENNPEAYYSSVDPRLYNTIMMKFMAPPPSLQPSDSTTPQTMQNMQGMQP